MKKIILILICVGTLLACAKEEKTLVVASKEFTENIILAELMAQIIEEHTDITVKRKLSMGSTFIVFKALELGDVDMYPDYTGTIYQSLLKRTGALPSTDEVFEQSRSGMAENGIMVYESFGFNNTYAIALLEEKASELNIRTISDLSGHPTLIAGFEAEFIARPDGGLAMFEFYGLTFDDQIKQVDRGLRLFALAENEIDFTDAYATDSKLLRYNITLLEDDKAFFPPYYAVPLVNTKAVEKYPEIDMPLKKLANVLTEQTMTELNYKVEEDKEAVGDVVREFLEKMDL